MRTTVSLCHVAGDGTVTIQQWLADAWVTELIRERLGAPVCEVMVPRPVLKAASEEVLDTSAVVVFGEEP